MSPTALTQVGAYPLTTTGHLPNVDVASPGEVWSTKRASGIIVPGSLVRPVMVGEVPSVVPIAEGDVIVADGAGIRQQALAVAMRQIATPDINPGSQYNLALGPNEIVNLSIADKDYLRSYHTGVLHLTLCVPDAGYKEGGVLGWDPKGTRPTGKAAGEGAWAKVDHADVVAGTGILIIDRPPRYYGSENEALLTCRFLRSNQ